MNNEANKICKFKVKQDVFKTHVYKFNFAKTAKKGVDVYDSFMTICRENDCKNLISNALKYMANNTVFIGIYTDGGEMRTIFENRGVCE